MNLYTYTTVNFKQIIGTRENFSLYSQVFTWEVKGVQEGSLCNLVENLLTQMKKNKYGLRDENISFERLKKSVTCSLRERKKMQSLKGAGSLLGTKCFGDRYVRECIERNPGLFGLKNIQ